MCGVTHLHVAARAEEPLEDLLVDHPIGEPLEALPARRYPYKAYEHRVSESTRLESPTPVRTAYCLRTCSYPSASLLCLSQSRLWASTVRSHVLRCTVRRCVDGFRSVPFRAVPFTLSQREPAREEGAPREHVVLLAEFVAHLDQVLHIYIYIYI